MKNVKDETNSWYDNNKGFAWLIGITIPLIALSFFVYVNIIAKFGPNKTTIEIQTKEHTNSIFWSIYDTKYLDGYFEDPDKSIYVSTVSAIFDPTYSCREIANGKFVFEKLFGDQENKKKDLELMNSTNVSLFNYEFLTNIYGLELNCAAHEVANIKILAKFKRTDSGWSSFSFEIVE